MINLIDTPGHVDFSYEVSRVLASCEGALLLIDAGQGVQAQTLATLDMARKAGLKIIPAINKIDLPEARPEEIAFEVAEVLGCDLEEIIFVSAKTGEGVSDLLKEVIKRVPPPSPPSLDKPRALVFDSYYDDFRGVVVYVRVFDGSFKKNQGLYFVAQKTQSDISDLGEIKLGLKSLDSIEAGEIGYIVTTLREVSQARVGDTLTTFDKKNKGEISVDPLEGYLEPKPVVFAEFYTTSGEDYNRLRDGLLKLKLSDSSISFEPTSSAAFGFGFRLGFLGLLHLEIVKERLEREYDLELVVTTPTVEYKKDADGSFLEPYVKAELILPKDYLGRVIELLESKRGEQVDIRHLEEKVILDYEIPLSEIIVDFYDRLKSVTSGYGSINYEICDFRKSDLVELNFMIAGEKVDVFTRFVYRGFAQRVGRKMVEKMKEFVPRQNFEVRIQAAIGGNIIASERIAPFRKDVTEKLYGGDVTRKRKLLEKQKKGKKKMAQVGRVALPTDVFVKLLKY
ncbi:MAG: Elongation factor 4 [candidate division WS2 bacterium ADurb.Bin280]|uniref:Elongation factor 4 n=1 Tax=candidate division WS2 bacterium ADurb.Bin280 TaxID=1852829 RepID=A0A1V5SC05_9BACT|nr:MAG: Elongation factor 4 [candidate division WS2 bacterium ADurb.Bin280]